RLYGDGTGNDNGKSDAEAGNDKYNKLVSTFGAGTEQEFFKYVKIPGVDEPAPLHWLENPFAIPGAEPRAIFLRQAHDEVVLMQADKQVAVGKRCRIAEHFTARHGDAGRHRLVE